MVRAPVPIGRKDPRQRTGLARYRAYRLLWPPFRKIWVLEVEVRERDPHVHGAAFYCTDWTPADRRDLDDHPLRGRVPACP